MNNKTIRNKNEQNANENKGGVLKIIGTILHIIFIPIRIILKLTSFLASGGHW